MPETQQVPERAQDEEIRRRALLLQSAAGLALAAGGLDETLAAAPSFSTSSALLGSTPGKPGDFDFLTGNWQIAHRRLLGKSWDEFPGEATCWSILGGVGSVEELRIPARGFSGMGLRLLDLKAQRWFDFWVNAKSGVLTPPGMPGSFEEGGAGAREGRFYADETDEQGDNKPMLVRGVWDRISTNGCRWHQAVSRDGGRSWETNWLMDWRRV